MIVSFPLACADFAFPLLPHDNALDLISILGFQGVDIGLFEGRSHLHPSKVLFDREAAAVLRQKVSDRGMNVADVFLQMDPDFHAFAINHPDAHKRGKARDWFLRTLDYAAACGSPHVTLLPGVLFEDGPAEDSLARCWEELRWRVDQARAANISFGIEAHVGSIVPTPKEALDLVKAIEGLTLTVDYTHFVSNGLPDSQIEPLLAFASHFHARCARAGRLQCSLKDNVIDYGRVINAMKSTGYTGYVGVEYVWIDWQHCNEVDNLSETILLRDLIKAQMASES
jgi:sugar phosphate isomerase/epimerase